MTETNEKKTLCSQLTEIMNEINGLLKNSGEEMSRYQSINKIKNIAKNYDPSGLKKIPKYLDGISSVISDNKVFSSILGRKLNEAYALSTQLNRLTINPEPLHPSI